MDHQVWIAFSHVMVLVFQLNHFLAFISDLGESKPNLYGAVIHILGKARTQGLVNIFSNFPNFLGRELVNANGTGLQGTCSGESGQNGNIAADPVFVNASNNNFRLLGGSPAIDVGDNSAPSLPAFDLASNRRIINGNNGPAAIVDMGAYEFIPVILSSKSLSFGLQTIGSSTSKTVKLTNAQNKILNVSSYSVPVGYAVTGCGSTVPAFMNCSITVTLQPSTSGIFNGTL